MKDEKRKKFLVTLSEGQADKLEYIRKDETIFSYSETFRYILLAYYKKNVS